MPTEICFHQLKSFQSLRLGLKTSTLPVQYLIRSIKSSKMISLKLLTVVIAMFFRGCLQTVKTPCRLSLKTTEIKTFIHIHYPRNPHPVPGHCKAPPYSCLASPFHSSSIDFASRPVKRLVPYLSRSDIFLTLVNE